VSTDPLESLKNAFDMRLLDLGLGYGTFANNAVERLARALAVARIGKYGLGDAFRDYARTMTELFDFGIEAAGILSREQPRTEITCKKGQKNFVQAIRVELLARDEITVGNEYLFLRSGVDEHTFPFTPIIDAERRFLVIMIPTLEDARIGAYTATIRFARTVVIELTVIE
jgi:hypothetical protein